jgi:hypothetical protein
LRRSTNNASLATKLPRRPASSPKCADSHNVHDAAASALLVAYMRNGPDVGKPNEREPPNDKLKGSSMTDRFMDEIETRA